MKIYLLSILVVFFSLSVTKIKAQPGMQDVIYLHNGSVIKGSITEHIIGTQVKIMTYGGNIFSFQYSEIEKMAKEEIPFHIANNDITNEPVEPKQDGITGNFYYGLNAGENIGISILFNMSYVIKYHYSLGLGMGIEGFNRQAYFPIFLNFEYRPIKGISTPYFYVMGGYSSPPSDNRGDYNGGILVEGGMGFRIYGKSSKIAFLSGIGFRYQESSFNYTFNEWNGVIYKVSGKDFFRRIPVRFGLVIE